MLTTKRIDLTGYTKMNSRQLRICMTEFIIEPGEVLEEGYYDPNTKTCVLLIHNDHEGEDYSYQSGPVPDIVKLLKEASK